MKPYNLLNTITKITLTYNKFALKSYFNAKDNQTVEVDREGQNSSSNK